MAGLTGSDLPARAGFRTVADPYTGAESVAIPAIAPDWAIVHVQEADAAGNARIHGPRYDDVYVARAARHLLVTTERLVEGSAFAAQPALTDFPAFLVDAVVVAPRGAWPTSCPQEYPADEAFLAAYVAAAQTEAGFQQFLRERVLAAPAAEPGAPTAPGAAHVPPPAEVGRRTGARVPGRGSAPRARPRRLTSGHRRRLMKGSRRRLANGRGCRAATGRRHRPRARPGPPGQRPSPPRGAPYSPADLMACVIARLLRDGETVFFGLASPLAMLGVLLAKETHAPGLTILNIPGGMGDAVARLPRSTVDASLTGGSRYLFTLAEVFDLSARGRLDTVLLSGVQIDHEGRINMSLIGDRAEPRVALPGGAGSALLLPTAGRTILWRSKHDARTFVERLEYVTAAGPTSHVVTPLCLFERRCQPARSRHRSIRASPWRRCSRPPAGPSAPRPRRRRPRHTSWRRSRGSTPRTSAPRSSEPARRCPSPPSASWTPTIT